MNLHSLVACAHSLPFEFRPLSQKLAPTSGLPELSLQPPSSSISEVLAAALSYDPSQFPHQAINLSFFFLVLCSCLLCALPRRRWLPCFGEKRERENNTPPPPSVTAHTLLCGNRCFNPLPESLDPQSSRVQWHHTQFEQWPSPIKLLKPQVTSLRSETKEPF